ncbi:cyclase family protein [Mycobacterium sp. M26]|uniref:cyclase family protein n=1 Tax=Mycobacterium sp. M26 TaxID=1762962 RepID=UPI00073EEDF4|nr:cyclase family protein [Mycobacterium sp. M26]
MIVDLSHTIRAGLVTYPGLPAPSITPHLTREASREIYAPGTEFAMDVITMIGNTGTYLDSPFHRFSDGGDLASLDLNTLVDLPAVVIHHRGPARAVDTDDLPDDIAPGSAVLIDTGWDRHFGTETYGVGAPFLTENAAHRLVDARVALVGIDSVNIDDTCAATEGARPVHTVLLDNRIHVVEHLTNLAQLPDRGARFTAAPPRIEGFGTFPVRAYAIVPD